MGRYAWLGAYLLSNFLNFCNFRKYGKKVGFSEGVRFDVYVVSFFIMVDQ